MPYNTCRAYYTIPQKHLYRYMEDYEYKYFHKLPQFTATLISRNNRSVGMKPNPVKNSDFMSTPCSKHLREYKNVS